MSKETDIFLNNECMKSIKKICDNCPNDMELGKQIRHYVNSIFLGPTPTKSQLNMNFGDLDSHGDVDEY